MNFGLIQSSNSEGKGFDFALVLTYTFWILLITFRTTESESWRESSNSIVQKGDRFGQVATSQFQFDPSDMDSLVTNM